MWLETIPIDMCISKGVSMKCEVCGNDDFVPTEVLWDALVLEWQISEFERSYIDRQQGTKCSRCGSNIRSQALARSVMNHWNFTGTFSEFADEKKDLKILELNEAAQLSGVLATMPSRILAEYPEIDMQRLPYASNSFDLVVHSDTLEHVPNPVEALTECQRVLKDGGLLAYTVPVIVDRMSRTRDGMSPSYHGSPGDNANDYIVISEYGANMWIEVIKAGFDAVTITTFDYPAGISISASKGRRPQPQRRKAPQASNLFRRFLGLLRPEK